MSVPRFIAHRSSWSFGTFVVLAATVLAAVGTLSAAAWLAEEVGFDPDQTIPLMVSDADPAPREADGVAITHNRPSEHPRIEPPPASPAATTPLTPRTPRTPRPPRTPRKPRMAPIFATQSEQQPAAASAAESSKIHKRHTRERLDRPTFDGRPIRAVKRMTMLVTAYSPDEQSCGIHADGITASGYSVWTNGMKLVAADTRLLPFGSIVSIPGYHGGKPVPVLDRGGKIKGNSLDVLYPTHEIAKQWGAKRLEVVVWEYAD